MTHNHKMYLSADHNGDIVGRCAYPFCEFELSEREIVEVITTQHDWVKADNAYLFSQNDVAKRKVERSVTP